jgi:glutamine amidotransferase
MCRLFGLHAGRSPVAATFWLLDARDSLAQQSRRNPDGAGIGTFDAAGLPVVDKQPLAAWRDTEFASAARELRSSTFLAHVRYASTGSLSLNNTHPFVQAGRLFAHNGVVHGLGELDARLETLRATHLVHGETDSERVFALVTAETSRRGGDVTAGLEAAVDWINEHLPVYSLNLLLTTASDCGPSATPPPTGSTSSPGRRGARSQTSLWTPDPPASVHGPTTSPRGHP